MKGYGYGITKVVNVKVHKKMKAMVGGVDVLKLMRLRNPWSERMWTGAWSDEYVTLADPLIITGNTVRVTPPSHRIITFLILPI